MPDVQRFLIDDDISEPITIGDRIPVLFDWDSLLESELRSLAYFLIQTAACVYNQASGQHHNGSPLIVDGTSPATQLIRTHRAVNAEGDCPEQAFYALQAQARFLYDFVRFECERGSMVFTKGPMLSLASRRIIAAALEFFEKGHRGLVERVRREFKTAAPELDDMDTNTPFISMTATDLMLPCWSEFNEQFLALHPCEE